MSETPSEQQYREAKEAVAKLEPWRLAEIRAEFGIAQTAPRAAITHKEPT